jgi:glycine/serine hydroxymethyltransferase
VGGFMQDKMLKKYLNEERLRQKNTIELIASENFVSKEVMKMAGSILTNKYAEGYPGHRYYGGCHHIDEIESLAKERLLDIFKAKNYNVASAGIRNSVSLYDADLKKPLLLVIGGEKRGISSDVLAKSDMIVRIDYGKTFRGSLTASSAATVLAFEVYRQNKS